MRNNNEKINLADCFLCLKILSDFLLANIIELTLFKLALFTANMSEYTEDYSNCTG